MSHLSPTLLVMYTTCRTPHPLVLASEPRARFRAHRPDQPADGACDLTALDVDDDTGLPADAELAGLVAALRQVDRWAARAVRLAGRLDGARAAAEEGMTVDTALRLHTGATRSDLTTVLTAAEILARMPATASLFQRGILSWGHVRALTTAARSLDATTRATLDSYLGAHARRLETLDSDGRLAAIDDAVAHHTPAARLEDRAERDTQGRLLVLSPRLDGSGTLFGDLDTEGFAAVAGRLDAEADTPQTTPSPGDDARGLPAYAREPATSGSRGRLLADALVRLCEQPAADRRGTPVRFTVIVDAQQVTDTIAGTIQTTLATRPPRLVRRAIERLSCDAAYDVVVRDGADLIAAQRYAPDVTTATRRAITARDGGCRWPGCRAPVSWCDIHHVVPRALTASTGGNPDGDHHPTNLVLLCRRHHTTVHRRGWGQALGSDGTYRLTRRGRDWTTLPRSRTPLPPPTAGTPGSLRRRPRSGHDPPGPNPPHPNAHLPDAVTPSDAAVLQPDGDAPTRPGKASEPTPSLLPF